MAPTAVSSVLYVMLLDIIETPGVYCGDAASFHDWEFRTRLRFAGKLVINTPKRCPKSVMDCVVTNPARHKKLASINLCEIVDGRPRGIDTLTRHGRGMVFPLTENESKELFRQYGRPGGPLSRQNGETETACPATTTLLDTAGSDGPSDSSQ